MANSEASRPPSQPPPAPGQQALPYRIQAAIKRIQLDFLQHRVDSRQAFAGIFDALAENLSGAVGYEEFQRALSEQIPAQIFQVCVQAGIISVQGFEPQQFHGVSLTGSRLLVLRQRYGHPLQIVRMCHRHSLLQKAGEFIERKLSVEQAGRELLDLLAELDEQWVIRSHIMPDAAAHGEAAGVIDVTPVAEPDRQREGAKSLWLGLRRLLGRRGPEDEPARDTATADTPPRLEDDLQSSTDPSVGEQRGSDEPPGRIERQRVAESPLDSLRRILTSLGRDWDEIDARLWLLVEELDLEKLIRQKTVEWQEKELRRLAHDEAAKGAQAAKSGEPIPPAPRRRPGPKPDLETAQTIAAVVEEHADWKAELDDVCDELDSRRVPPPDRRGGPAYKDWLDALGTGKGGDRDRVIKAVEYHLKKLRQA